MEIYVVRAGDSVDSIAALLEVPVSEIIFDNQLVYPYELAVGQALFIGSAGNRNQTAESGAGTQREKREIAVAGYAYPFINEWVLSQTLPYLSELPIFSYGFSLEGELIAPLWDDEWMIREARAYGVRPVLTLTPFGTDGQFNNMLISSVVNNISYGENLVQNLLRVMREKGYQGVDIDFEYILASDRDAFTDFVGRVAERMREEGYVTSVALAPKTSGDQKGLLYEGKDYAALGARVDHVLLMTYEWGYTYPHSCYMYFIPELSEIFPTQK
ncbi:MAG: glycosyl hydrolase family 18 protein [Candidatus Gastranaerophilales bacterium]|nr:glycosyl hydrolase family 18 protein [Candidatus Gastranaerophilales bacterium]